jgi:hypothetical protein
VLRRRDVAVLVVSCRTVKRMHSMYCSTRVHEVPEVDVHHAQWWCHANTPALD